MPPRLFKKKRAKAKQEDLPKETLELPEILPNPTFALKSRTFSLDGVPPERMKPYAAEVNSLIKAYNHAKDHKERLDYLAQIQVALKKIDDTFPAFLAYSYGYQNACSDLYQEMQAQHKEIKKEQDPMQEKGPLSLPELMKAMSPLKVNALLKILSAKSNRESKSKLEEALNDLYEPSDDSEEAKHFRQCLKDNEIEFLAGKNSYNYHVTPRFGQSKEYVLKVENNFGHPKIVESQMRSQLPGVLTAIEAERQAYRVIQYTDDSEESIHRTVIVTEFCKGGSLYHYAKKQPNTPEFVKNAAPVLSDLSSALLGMQLKGIFFPDAKITNWLVDEKGRIRVSDTKSLCFVDKNGYYQGRGYTHTEVFDPPEIFDYLSFGKPPPNADAVHAYILGKNIYCYLKGREHYDEAEEGNLNFNHEMFKTPEGKEYRRLILALTHPDPSKRMSLGEANNRLFILAHPDCKAVFSQLHKLSCGAKDKVMESYILDKQKEYANASPEERIKILEKLESYVKECADFQALQGTITQYRNRAGLLTVGMKDKANLIEDQVVKLSVEERRNPKASSTFQAIEEAVASHRHLGRKAALRSNSKEIDTGKAAKGFKSFKERFSQATKEVEKEVQAVESTVTTPKTP